MSRRRLDEEMVARGISADLQAARSLIHGRCVRVSGSTAVKPETLVAKKDAIVLEERRRFVSRGGEKLQGALEDLNIDVTGTRCLDAGTGSGGFTDCLLRNGAAEITAVDVGYGQFDYNLRMDQRVHLFERTHIAKVTVEQLGGPFDLVVADLSFTSAANLIWPLSDLMNETGHLLVLVKPQFEAPRSKVPIGGVVKDPDVWLSSLVSVADAMDVLGISVTGACASRIKGAEGNQEFFILGQRGMQPRPQVLSQAVGSVS